MCRVMAPSLRGANWIWLRSEMNGRGTMRSEDLSSHVKRHRDNRWEEAPQMGKSSAIVLDLYFLLLRDTLERRAFTSENSCSSLSHKKASSLGRGEGEMVLIMDY